MGVYIKGLEMPKKCINCKFCVDMNDYPFHACFITDSDIPFDIDKLENCPLVGIKTPHGKIIEVGKIQSKIENQLKGEEITWYQLREVRRYIHDAPTILEAEEK